VAGASEVRLVTHIVSPSPCRCKGACVSIYDPTTDLMGQISRDLERQAELSHERQLAAIRKESHALVWTGTPKELTTTIARWYESGWIFADSLQDALRKAGIHFVRPDGMPVIKPSVSAKEPETIEAFSPSPTYQKLIFRGKEYDLTHHIYAPVILKVLHESLNKGESGMTTNQIRKSAKLSNNGKMYDWFRGTGLWKHLVIVIGKDMYRLDIPTKP
jgi:hypothetical protein